mmetsp:Transcript_91403/g.295675  ORF Transcript_91403/g.295675 Transcript_91403/m.295675 type:complete len:369 (-) Transcript_91403:2142-3248(-)
MGHAVGAWDSSGPLCAVLSERRPSARRPPGPRPIEVHRLGEGPRRAGLAHSVEVPLQVAAAVVATERPRHAVNVVDCVEEQEPILPGCDRHHQLVWLPGFRVGAPNLEVACGIVLQVANVKQHVHPRNSPVLVRVRPLREHAGVLVQRQVPRRQRLLVAPERMLLRGPHAHSGKPVKELHEHLRLQDFPHGVGRRRSRKGVADAHEISRIVRVETAIEAVRSISPFERTLLQHVAEVHCRQLRGQPVGELFGKHPVEHGESRPALHSGLWKGRGVELRQAGPKAPAHLGSPCGDLWLGGIHRLGPLGLGGGWRERLQQARGGSPQRLRICCGWARAHLRRQARSPPPTFNRDAQCILKALVRSGVHPL